MRFLVIIAALLFASPAIAQQTGNNAATPVAAASLVVSPGYLGGITVTTGATAGYLMLFDAAAAPADGAVAPARCIPVAATTGVDMNFRAAPIWFRTGIVAVFSSTGCFTKTASATAFIAVDYR